MRKSFSIQLRLDCSPVGSVQLNTECRDEIVPILAALQHVYSQSNLRASVTGLIAREGNKDSRDDVGREGCRYGEVAGLAWVGLGCELDYDKLQDLAENHRALRAG